MDEANIIRPQEGFQEAFLSSSADIVIGGGSAGSGKTFALLLEFVRNINVSGFGGVIFRRTTPQIRNEGGLWDTSEELYPLVGGIPKDSINTWVFPKGPKIKFNHLEYENDKLNHQGAQYPFIGFDELTHFSRSQFFYLVSRNRSVCGVRPYVRATCNPDPDSWVADFISWWIDQETGFPIRERSGVVRYFTRDAGNIVWGSSYEEVVEKCPHIFNQEQFKKLDKRDLIKSVTFIPGSVYENKKLMQKDPAYLGNLLSLDEAEQMRLLKGNWKIRQDGSALFNYVRINDLFTNFVKDLDFKCITCDAARFGQDFAIIYTWTGWKLVRIQILTRSKTTDITKAIEKERERMGIPVSQVLVDQDGVGGGVVDEGGYVGFTNGGAPLPDPKTGIKENYPNLKTQCYYRMSEKVNAAQVAVDLSDIVIDGEQRNEIKIGSNIFTIRKLITNDLRAVKKKKQDSDGKLQINSKEEMKNTLGGRSPDLGDTLMMRSYFDLEEVGSPEAFII